MAKRYELSDEELEKIKDLFPISKTGRPVKQSNQIMLNAILRFARSGSAREDIPLVAIHRIKAYIAVFVSGVMMEH